MKKLFVCAMALAAFVSCSKDDVQGPALDSANKTVSIAIKNSAVATRADEAGITTPADGKHNDKVASATADQLYVLFVDGTTVKNILPLAAGSSDDEHTGIEDHNVPAGQYVAGETKSETVEDKSVLIYTWHNVPWEVDNIAVVRIDHTDKDKAYFTVGEDGTVNILKNSLTDYETLAKDEPANLTRELSDIVLYGQAPLVDTNETHEVNEITYHYWRADVIVAPQFARFEINNIECEDLGYYNLASEGNNATYGFDEMDVLSLTWTSNKGSYSITPEYVPAEDADAIIGRMYGQYVNTNPGADKNTYAGTEDRAAAEADNVQPAGGNVWSWNILPSTWKGMEVGLWAYAYDYELQTDGRDLTLKVVGLNGAAGDYDFEKGKIYKLDLTFTEGDVKDQDQLCVEVTVDIANWTIVDNLNPKFDN